MNLTRPFPPVEDQIDFLVDVWSRDKRSTAVRTVTASDSFGPQDSTIFGDATAGTVTLTLPSVIDQSGSPAYSSKKTDSSANAVTVLPANATFTSDSTTEICLLANNGFDQTGIPVQLSNSGGALPTPFVAATTYFTIYVNPRQIKLATTLANAKAGTAINITGNGTGTQTMWQLIDDAQNKSTTTQYIGYSFVVDDAMMWRTQSLSATGSVTSVSVTTANGVSGTVATPTTTPAISLTLGAITPTSVSTGALTSSALTAGRVAFAGTAGLLSDSSNLLWDNTNVKLTAQNTAGKTITAADTLYQLTRSGAITNNTSTLANNALNISNTCTSVGSQNVANIGSNITVSGADLNIGTAVNSTGTGIFIGPSLPASQIVCSLHSTSTASRQFLFNRTEIGITATDGTYFSVQSSGEFWINNQENQPLRFFIADYEQVRIAQTATADRYLIFKGGLSSGSPANATIDVSGGSLAITPAVISASTIKAGTTLNTAGYTVATLPTGVTGATAYVTDALAPTFLATVVGGGAIVTPVFYNGSAWIGA